MRALIAGLCSLAAVGSAFGAPTTSQRGAYAIVSGEAQGASLYVEETSDVVAGTSSSEGSLSLTRNGQTETVACSWSMPDDPVVLGSARLTADCGTYAVVTLFEMNGGGTGVFAIPCSAHVSRPMRATVRITQEDVVVLNGITEDARVWRAVDSGTCDPA